MDLAALAGQSPELATRCVVLPSTASTNADARRLASEGAPHGTSVVAAAQTAGRGRLGRCWEAAPGDALLVSVVLRPGLSPRIAPLTAFAASVALADAIGAPTLLKWPNDVLAPDRRKLAGILAERDPDGAWLVLGFGVNVRAAPSHLPAACLADLGVHLSRGELLARLLPNLLQRFGQLQRDPCLVLDAWRSRSGTLGSAVRVNGVEGTASALDPDGALVVTTAEGAVRVMAGDVSLLG